MSAGAANVAPLNARVSFARCFCVPVISPRARCCSVLLVGLNPLMTVFPPFWGRPRRSTPTPVRGWRPHRRPLNGRTRKQRFCHRAGRFFERRAQRFGCSGISAHARAAFLRDRQAPAHARRASVHLRQGTGARTPWRRRSDAHDSYTYATVLVHVRPGVDAVTPPIRGPTPGHSCTYAVAWMQWRRRFTHLRQGIRTRMRAHSCEYAVASVHGHRGTHAAMPSIHARTDWHVCTFAVASKARAASYAIRAPAP